MPPSRAITIAISLSVTVSMLADTKGASSKELQATADKVKPGIIMYSEGMAVPKDMPGIVAGRVHDALVLPPPLNLNKFIKPDFAIYRVLQLADDRLHRELAISFFNSYGVEIITMRPGRPSWIREEFAYLGRTTKILRENNMVFHNYDWMPLLPSMTDSIYVNRWISKDKKEKTTGLKYFIIQLTLNAFWSIIFFGMKSKGGGVITIIILWLLILATIITSFRVSGWAGALLIPYIVWVSIASYLNIGVWLLNKPAKLRKVTGQ